MKRYIYSNSPIIVRHFSLLVLFTFLPFVFSDRLIETETTLRYIASGVLTGLLFTFILAVAYTGTICLPVWRKNFFYPLLIVFITFLGFTILHSVNKGEAIYDFLKVCTISGYFLLFVIFFLNVENALPLLLKYINVAVFIFTLIALSQIGMQLQTAGHLHIIYMLASSLGNKNFYAETMLLMLPLILMAVWKLRGGWRFVSMVNVLIILGTILLLQALSTWLAMSVFLFFSFSILIYVSGSGQAPARNKWPIIIGLLVIAGVAIAILYRADQFTLIKNRIAKINEYAHSHDGYTREDDIHPNSVAERIFLWRNAWHMFRDYPIAGAGLDNWKIYSTRYELPFSRQVMNISIRYLRPHNDLLLILAEAGIIGFVMYISLFVYALFLGFRILRMPTARDAVPVIWLAMSGLIIYLVIACTSLPGDRFYTQIFLFLFFAIICAEYDRQPTDAQPSSPAGRKVITAICLAALISGSAISYIGYKRYASEIHLLYALQAQAKKDWKKMSYHSAMAKNFFFPVDFTAAPIAWYQGMAAFYSGSPTISKYYFEEALRANPYDLNVLNDLATAMQREGDNERAGKTYDLVLSIAPYYSSSFMNKVVMIYNSGDHDKALTYLKTFPIHTETYKSMMNDMLTNKAIEALADTSSSTRMIVRKKNLIKMDSIATAEKISFEQVILRDTALARLKK